MSDDQFKHKIRSFITNRFLVGRPEGFLKDSDAFLERGILDSTGILELVGYLEEEFGIAVEDVELVPDNLGSVDNVVKYLARKVRIGV